MGKDNFKTNPLTRKKKKRSSVFSDTKPVIEVKAETSVDYKEIVNLENKNFDYKKLDKDTEKFLKRKEYNIHEIGKKFYTDLGKELKEAKEKLEKKGYGFFSEWCKSLGFSRRQAYRLINRYKYILEQKSAEKQKRLENMGLSLVYELIKGTTPQDLKDKVLEGEITSYTEFKELKKEYIDDNEEDKKDERNYRIVLTKKKIKTKKEEIRKLLKSEIGEEESVNSLIEKILNIIVNN